MPISRLPGVYYTEQVSAEIDSNGAKIPVFIGVTNNPGSERYKVDGTEIKSYRSYEAAAKLPDDGGVGKDSKSNPLLQRLKEFFEENQRKKPDELQVPNVFVIDCGNGKTMDPWINALSTAKSRENINIELYIQPNISNNGNDLNSILSAASKSFKEYEKNLMLRTAIYDLGLSVSDENLILTGKNHKFARIGLAEPYLFGKTVARICCTPYYLEPGFIPYRSVTKNTFKRRTPEIELSLQNAGVIFNHDERTGKTISPKMNLGVLSTFAESPRPADSLFHIRCNADHLLKSIFEVCYKQIKANENSTNLIYLQTQIDKIVYDEVMKGYMKEYDGTHGTSIKLKETDNYPYEITLTGQIQPVNSTVAIDVYADIKGAL